MMRPIGCYECWNLTFGGEHCFARLIRQGFIAYDGSQRRAGQNDQSTGRDVPCNQAAAKRRKTQALPTQCVTRTAKHYDERIASRGSVEFGSQIRDEMFHAISPTSLS